MSWRDQLFALSETDAAAVSRRAGEVSRETGCTMGSAFTVALSELDSGLLARGPGVFEPAGERTVRFFLIHEPNDCDPDYRWQCRVIMTWALDGDGLPRTENGHGETREHALAMARRIAAAFMFEENVGSEEWPGNDIDHLGES